MVGSQDIASLGAILQVIFICFLIAPLSPFIAELITLQFMPDPSKGLHVLTPHTPAEKKVIQGDLRGAIEEYEKVLEDNPDDTNARLRMAELCIEIGQYERAVEAYESTLKISPKLAVERHCFVLTRLSEVYGQYLGDAEKAHETAQAIIERFPNSSYAKFAKERLSGLQAKSITHRHPAPRKSPLT